MPARTNSQFGDALRPSLDEPDTFRCVKPRATVELRALDELMITESQGTTVVHTALALHF